jgi:hypothetical protein
MELEKAERLARHLMVRHGLKNWSFKFDRAKNRLGLTTFHTRTISISRHMVIAGTREHVHQTMLHEIAHALLPPSAGHGPEWKKKAASLGYTGQRTADNPARPDITERNKRAKHLLSISAAESGVRIGDRLKFPDGTVGKVTKVARKKFHGDILTPRGVAGTFSIHFGFAIQYKIS